MRKKSVLITGIGLISSLAEGVEAHWHQLTTPPPLPFLENQIFAPYGVHALPPIDWSSQIPKRGDQRQMETWQRLGTYAAGMALDDAGMKGNWPLISSMDMIVAAGGGERDANVDEQILQKAREIDRADSRTREIMLNEMLSSELRPTLFLAQLSNLLAGNISIVHKVTGSSRTFMGEEGSGLAAIETAAARISSGQSRHILVGSSYNSEHFDMLLGAELGQHLHRDKWAPVWTREEAEGGGLITGSGGVFLVLEEEEHARGRGAHAYAKIEAMVTDQSDRAKVPLGDTLARMMSEIGATKGEFTVSGASGAHHITQVERQILEQSGLNYRGFSSLLGHMREAQFIFAMALAALALSKGEAFAPVGAAEQQASDKAPKNIEQALVTTAGLWRAEGVARLSKANLSKTDLSED